MTPNEIQILQRACQAAGINASKIKPENPFTKSGTTATLLQASVAEFAPEQAAKWRCEAGSGLSIQTLSEIQAGGDLSEAAMNDLWQHDHQFVADKQREKSTAIENQLAWLEAEADKKRRAREGDKAVDFQNAKAAAEKEARAESAKHVAEMQQRIDQKRVADARMAGVITNG